MTAPALYRCRNRWCVLAEHPGNEPHEDSTGRNFTRTPVPEAPAPGRLKNERW